MAFGMGTFSWPCPLCGTRNTEPVAGVKTARVAPCCGDAAEPRTWPPERVPMGPRSDVANVEKDRLEAVLVLHAPQDELLPCPKHANPLTVGWREATRSCDKCFTEVRQVCHFCESLAYPCLTAAVALGMRTPIYRPGGCVNYSAPTTCLTAPSSATGRCDHCKETANA